MFKNQVFTVFLGQAQTVSKHRYLQGFLAKIPIFADFVRHARNTFRK